MCKFYTAHPATICTSAHRLIDQLKMAGLSFNVLRTGKKYRLTNFGDQHDFTIESVLGNGDFKVKDLHTLESYHLQELLAFGKGKDFMLEDLPEEEQ